MLRSHSEIPVKPDPLARSTYTDSKIFILRLNYLWKHITPISRTEWTALFLGFLCCSAVFRLPAEYNWSIIERNAKAIIQFIR